MDDMPLVDGWVRETRLVRHCLEREMLPKLAGKACWLLSKGEHELEPPCASLRNDRSDVRPLFSIPSCSVLGYQSSCEAGVV